MKANLINFITFPTPFTYKVICFADINLPEKIVNIVQQYVPGNYFPDIKMSRKKNFYSVSITINAINVQQIEILYDALSNIPAVRMVL
ncbi:DUF493 family protein YbeD [Candidatus Erwinia haradaeae]|uniref:UPF0250 protein ERCICUMA2628_353 n=1 Tax=Candidatus Erwinia haradaeae TaxID=1922217 RepID=A0A451D2E3_9GAMM|nr:DUF493 family protein YbeD [Candidatus Erwinia haradaeae]VFP79807.1 UPF0250 protein YbeD [Candidatus Erwinia haradaeae]